LTEVVPVQKGAIDGRYIVQWDKDDIDSAGMVKIDFLALGALSQLQEALGLIQQRTGRSVDISRIDFEDSRIYDALCAGDTIGIFQVESAAQLQTITRIKPRNLMDMAHEVGCVRPGVGVNDGIREYIARRSGKKPITYDHPLEQSALQRTLGIILFQDQVNQLAISVAGFSPFEADQLRRAFGRRNNEELLRIYREKFIAGALARGVDEASAARIFGKFSGFYMFPEAHAVAFGVTAYQLAWLKYYYPLEFFTALINQQPMGFWGLETIKQDAKHHGIRILNPDINRSEAKCVMDSVTPPSGSGKPGSKGKGCIRLGFLSVSGIGEATAGTIVKARPYNSLGDFMRRTGLKTGPLESIIKAGAFDSLPQEPDRRSLLWETGLRYRPSSKQTALDLPVVQDMVALDKMNDWDRMQCEYQTMGLYPGSHLMEKLRPQLGGDIVSSEQLKEMENGQRVKVAGLVARPLQHPHADAYFITLEDDQGMIPLIIWPDVYEQFRQTLREPLLLIEGFVSRREGTMNVVVTGAAVPGAVEPTSDYLKLPRPMFR